MKPITEEMILQAAQKSNRQQKALVDRVGILELIKELREKGFEPRTILETIENKLKFDK